MKLKRRGSGASEVEKVGGREKAQGDMLWARACEEALEWEVRR